jgi:hypothetical protein
MSDEFTFTNDGLGMATRVVQRPDGAWAVELYDLDADQRFPMIRVYPSDRLTDAVECARHWIGC